MHTYVTYQSHFHHFLHLPLPFSLTLYLYIVSLYILYQTIPANSPFVFSKLTGRSSCHDYI